MIILNSGNPECVLQCYQEILSIDYAVGSKAKVANNRIAGITVEDYPSRDFKLSGCREIIDKLMIPSHEIVAIGNSLTDISLFEYCGRERSIAKDPPQEHKKILLQKAKYLVHDLNEARLILEMQLGAD